MDSLGVVSKLRNQWKSAKAEASVPHQDVANLLFVDLLNIITLV